MSGASGTGEHFFWGVDCGSTAIKVVLCDQRGTILQKAKGKTLFPLVEHVIKTMSAPELPESPFAEEADDPPHVKANHHITATGYGRHGVDFAHVTLTEIKAHFLGVKNQVSPDGPHTIVDIGGQDSKIVTILDSRVDRFAVNRKCAAGTGAFIEELAHRLELPLSDLTTIAQKHDKELSLNSYCTVFAVQEVVRILVQGEKVENLIHALYGSVVKRVLEMAPIATDFVVFTGGVIEHHPVLVDLFQQKLSGRHLVVSPNAQFCGAIGAALHGLSKWSAESGSAGGP